MLAIADGLRKVGHDVTIRSVHVDRHELSDCDAVVLVELEDEALAVEYAISASLTDTTVAALGTAVTMLVANDLAKGRVVAAPGFGELSGGALRSENSAVADGNLVTASGPHAVSDLVRLLRQQTEIPVAQDAETLAEVIEMFEGFGYTASVKTEPDGDLTCLGCRVASPAHKFRVDGLRRLEGASDPDDLLVVAALECPNCGARASLILGYGPNASSEDTKVLQDLDRVDERRNPAQG